MWNTDISSTIKKSNSDNVCCKKSVIAIAKQKSHKIESDFYLYNLYYLTGQNTIFLTLHWVSQNALAEMRVSRKER